MKLRAYFSAVRASALVGLIILIAPAGSTAREPVASEGYSQEIQIEPLLRTSRTSSGAPVVYPATTNPQVTALRVTIPPGTSTGWHEHPFPCYAYILSGVLTLELRDRPPLVFQAGEAAVEVVNTPHNGVNRGTEPVELVMFATGEEGKPISIRLPEPSPSGR